MHVSPRSRVCYRLVYRLHAWLHDGICQASLVAVGHNSQSVLVLVACHTACSHPARAHSWVAHASRGMRLHILHVRNARTCSVLQRGWSPRRKRSVFLLWRTPICLHQFCKQSRHQVLRSCGARSLGAFTMPSAKLAPTTELSHPRSCLSKCGAWPS